MARACGAAGILAVLLLATRVSAADACPACLRAGAASVALRVPAGAPLAGYGSLSRRLLLPDVLGRHAHAFWFKPHDGALDEVRARALVVETATVRVVWVTADLIAVGREFTARLARRLGEIGVPPGRLLLSASHTHSGPGAFIDSAVMGFISLDRVDEGVREALIGSLAEAVRRADASKTTARVGAGTTEAAGLTRGRLGHPPDREVVLVKVAAEDGTPIAALWNYAIHGTTLGARNRKLSGDVMGLASAEIERALGVPALFVNGAVGDVSPARHGLDEARGAGRALARAVLGAWPRTPASRRGPLEVASTRVSLPAPRLSLRNCLGRFLPRGLSLPLDSAFPRDAELHAGRLGDVAWVTIPGELQSQLGEAVKRNAGAGRTFLAGVTNDYLGYFVTSGDYDTVAYVTCASLYGPAAGERLVDAAGDLLRALPGAER
ncbi:MAG TPA: neutral/alkaline non-lysosomal ceramidase N-terminal domain-containing protein [Methylomirabilota bacterium]|nr:neutral/alkaline non-lysosomal ceramidase N-terminal domain-containing protein [Methylomirabilota bacterium]